MKYFFAFACFFASNFALASSANIYNPWAESNPNRLKDAGGYCKNASEEKQFWLSINKFTKSFLVELPLVPPEQKSYVDAEFNSGNSLRAIRVQSNPFYKIGEIHEQIKNLQELSSDYVLYHARLPIQKKMEFIGRTMANIYDDKIEYDDLQNLSNSLATKNYYISFDVLSSHFFFVHRLRRELITHMICYGENYRF